MVSDHTGVKRYMDLHHLNEVVGKIDRNGFVRLCGIFANLLEEKFDNDCGNPQEHEEDPLWTPAKAASHLGISAPTLRTYRTRYGMKSVGERKARRYPRSEVLKVLEKRGG